MALVAGALAAAVFAFFALGLGADQIITGAAVTMGGLGLTAAAYEARFGATGTALTLPTLEPLRVPLLSEVPIVGRALRAAAHRLRRDPACRRPLVDPTLHRVGLELRALGGEPGAAEAAGVHVVRARVLATIFGGALDGIAGAHLALAHTGTFAEGMSAGRASSRSP